MWKVKLRKVRATWYYYTENPQGGGFGSNNVGSKAAALARACQNIPDGATYQIYTDNKLTSTEIKGMKRFNPLKPQTPSSSPLTKARKAPRAPGAAEFTTTLTENERKDGLEIRFAIRPADDTLTTLKAHGWYWSRRRMCWYHKNTPENREFAQRFVNPQAPADSPVRVGSTAPVPSTVPATSPAPAEQPNVIPVQFTPEQPEPCQVLPASNPIWRARLIRQN